MLRYGTNAAVAITLLALASCKSSSVRVSELTPPLRPAEVVPAPSANASPIERLAIDAPACEAAVQYVTLKGRRQLTLCDATNRRCFLEIRATNQGVVVKTGMGKPASVMLEVPYGGMVLRGFIVEPDLYPARPIVFGGFFIPEQIDIAEGRDGAVLATTTMEASIAPKQLQQEITCADVAWEKPTFDAESFAPLTNAVGKGQPSTLAGGSTLFDDKGNAVATLASSRTVMAHQIVRGRRLVVEHIAGGTIFGWTPLTELSSLEQGRLGGSHRTRPPQIRLDPDPSRGLRCKQQVTVLALVDGSRLDVGTIPANTWLSPGEEADSQHQEILLRHPHVPNGELSYPAAGVDLVPGAKLVVEKRAIAGCESG